MVLNHQSELPFDGLVFLNVKGNTPICSPVLTFKYLPSSAPDTVSKGKRSLNIKHLRISYGF